MLPLGAKLSTLCDALCRKRDQTEWRRSSTPRLARPGEMDRGEGRQRRSVEERANWPKPDDLPDDEGDWCEAFLS